MLVKGTKWDAAENLLKLLVKSDTLYCEECGSNYDARFYPCCDNPLIGTHASHLRGLIDEITEKNKVNLNRYGATEKKNFRACFAMPKKLFFEWCKIFKKQHGEDLIRSYDSKLHRQDVRALMRRFPYLRRCETV